MLAKTSLLGVERKKDYTSLVFHFEGQRFNSTHINLGKGILINVYYYDAHNKKKFKRISAKSHK